MHDTSDAPSTSYGGLNDRSFTLMYCTYTTPLPSKNRCSKDTSSSLFCPLPPNSAVNINVFQAGNVRVAVPKFQSTRGQIQTSKIVARSLKNTTYDA